MDNDIRENCGVAGIYLKRGFAEEHPEFLPEGLYMMLLDMQHRGQQGCGIAVYNPHERKNFRVHKGLGMVKEVFRDSNKNERKKLIKSHIGKSGIGSVRYVTSSSIESPEQAEEEAQPLYRRHFRLYKRFAIAYNGNIANHSDLEKLLRETEDYDLETSVDTELIMALLALNLQLVNKDSKSKPDLVEVVNKLSQKIDGGYSVVILNGYGELIAFKDPHGIRPLVYGENGRFFAIASESSALNRIGIKDFIDVEPGELLTISDEGIKKQYYTNERSLRACCFENVYFSHLNSRINGIDDIDARKRLGYELAKIEPLRGKLDDSYVVVPVPNTSIPAAHTLAESLGIKIVNSLIRNEIVGRAFIEKDEWRERALENKFTVVPREVYGKKIIAVDDSIVRGETSMKIIDMLRQAGAVEIHLRSTFPPVRSPCFYGIDFPTSNELLATRAGDIELEEFVAKEIEADSVKYQTIEGMIRAIGTRNLCTACLTMDYPTTYGRIRALNLAGK